MSPGRSRLVLALAAVLASASGLSAQPVQNVVLRNSFNPIGAGARGLGMGGAFIAVADDGTAASFNPAGLAQLRRSELALVGFADELESSVRRPGGGDLTSAIRHGAPDFGGLSVPFEVGGRNLTLQLSYQRTVDLFGRGRASVVQSGFPLDEADPSAGTFDIVGEIAPEQSGAFHTAGLSAGYQVTPRLSLGLSFNYWFGNWTAEGATQTRFDFNFPGSEPDRFVTNAVRFRQEQELRGLNLTAGFLLRYSWISIGGVARRPFTGDYNLRERDLGQRVNFDTFELEPVDVDLKVTSRLHWPSSAGLGLALRPLRGLTLAGDYSRSHWSRTFIEDVPGGALLTPDDGSLTSLNFFDLFPQSLTSTTDTEQWRAGLEYLVTFPGVVIPLRGGVFRDRSPVAELLTGEGRRIEGWTVGTGFNFSRLVLDFAFERRESEGSVALLISGGQVQNAPRETVRESRLVASLIYRFGGADDPLKRLLRSLFVGPREEEPVEKP